MTPKGDTVIKEYVHMDLVQVLLSLLAGIYFGGVGNGSKEPDSWLKET